MSRPVMRRKNSTRTGVARRGVQGDLSAVLDKTRSMEDPRVERPSVLIRSLRYLGETEGDTPAAAMTAKSHALYEYLMASARLKLAEMTEHRVPFADAKAYLDVDRSDRIREYIDAISSTKVAYDFVERDGLQRIGRMQLLMCEEIVTPEGERYIGYMLHPSIRKIILDAREYAHLEVAAFARFKCKYTSRLYPRLALTAGMDVQYPIRFTPEELASFVGYPIRGDKLHFARFEADVLKPVDFDLMTGVKRFTTEYKLERAATRGRPVTAIVFHVSKSLKALEEIKRAKLTDADRQWIRDRIKVSGHDIAEIPRESLLAAAGTKLELDARDITFRWIDALKRAKADPEAVVGTYGTQSGRQLLAEIKNNGVSTAFKNWMNDYEPPNGVWYRDKTKPGFIKQDPETYQPPKAETSGDVVVESLDEAECVRITTLLDAEPADVKRFLIKIEAFQFVGDAYKRLIVVTKTGKIHEFTVPVSEDSLAVISEIGGDVIADVEFLK